MFLKHIYRCLYDVKLVQLEAPPGINLTKDKVAIFAITEQGPKPGLKNINHNMSVHEH